LNDQVIESDKQIHRYASLKNDDDSETDNKQTKPLGHDDDFYNPNINQTMNQILLTTILFWQGIRNVTMNHSMKRPKKNSDEEKEKEKEQFDFDEWLH